MGILKQSVSRYCMSEKSCLSLHRYPLYKDGQDFLDIQVCQINFKWLNKNRNNDKLCYCISKK